MKKKILLIFAASFISALVSTSARAQFTIVTGTVKDVNGVAYAGGTISASLVVPGGTSPTLNGVGFTGSMSPIGLDGTGSFTARLADNNVVLPGGTQWKFQVNITGAPPPLGTGPQTCIATITITGASQSVSGSFSSCPALSSGGGGGGALLPVAADVGVVNAYVVNPVPAVSLTLGASFNWTTTNQNTNVCGTNATMNASGTGVKTLMLPAASCVTAGTIKSGVTYSATWDGSEWILGGGNTFPASTTRVSPGQMFLQAIDTAAGFNGTFGAPLIISAQNPVPSRQPLLVFVECNVAPPVACTSGGNSQWFIGIDNDNVLVISGNQDMAFLNQWEAFGTNYRFLNGTGNQATPEISIQPGVGASGNGLGIALTDTVNTRSLFTLEQGSGKIGSKAWGSYTATDCASSASPAVCVADWHGSVAVPAGSTTLVVNTSAIEANSEVFLQEDSSLGAKLGVTCNTTPTVQPLTITARTAGTSFTFSNTSPTTNPRCVHFWIVGP